MIAGRRPYSALTILELRKEHVSVMPRRLDEVAPGVSRPFSDVIARAMAKDRSERPPTAGEFAAELRAALAATDNGSSQFAPALSDVIGSHSPQATAGVGQNQQTKSDIDAPTILTIDAAPPESSAPLQAGAFGATVTSASAIPTLVESADQKVLETSPSESAMTVADVLPARQIPVAPIPQPAPRSKLPLVIGVVLVLILLVGGVGGFLLVRSMRSKPVNDPGLTGTLEKPKDPGTPVVSEVARYWLQISDPADQTGKSMQVVPAIAIASGQYFKFHFVPTENGFLYIVGPGPTNKLTAFLTGTAASIDTGWSSNEVKGSRLERSNRK